MSATLDTQITEPVSYTNKISVDDYNKQKDIFTQQALKELNIQMNSPSFQNTTNTTKTHNNLFKTNKKISLSLPNSDNDDNNDNNDNDDNKNFEKKCKGKYNSKNSDSDYNEENEDNIDSPTSHSSLNLIVNHFTSEQTLKKRKIINGSAKKSSNTNNSNTTQNITMNDAIYAQHEIDNQIITKLKVQNNTLKMENQDLDSKKHYLTLDLSNAQCEIDTYKKQISYLKDQNIKLKQFIINIKKNDNFVILYLKSGLSIFIILCILILYILYL